MENNSKCVIEDGNLKITVEGYGSGAGIVSLQQALNFAIVQSGLSDRLDRYGPIAELEFLLKAISLDELQLTRLLDSQSKLQSLNEVIEKSCEGVHEERIKRLIEDYKTEHKLESDPQFDYIEKAQKYDKIVEQDEN